MNKHCELCGKLSSESHFSFVIEPNYFIYCTSEHVVRIDKTSHRVFFDDGGSADYLLMLGDNVAIDFDYVSPHIFCSPTCERTFESTYRPIVPNSIPIVSFKDRGCFVPLVFPIDMIGYPEDSICRQCGDKFPNGNKEFRVSKILKRKRETGSLNQMKSKALRDGYVLLSDRTDHNEVGHVFFLNVDIAHSKSDYFCSNECAFEFASKHECFIMYRNNMILGFITAISPYTIEINEGLKNPYLYRPFKMMLPKA